MPNQDGFGSGPTSGIHIRIPKPMKQRCWRACTGSLESEAW